MVKFRISTMHQYIERFTVLCLFSLACLPLSAQDTADPGAAAGMMKKAESTGPLEAFRSARECAVDGVALSGFDLISYHEANGPYFGSSEFSAEHAGNTYLFKSAENRDAFQAEPDRYLPTYDGWCAISLALGRLTCPDYSNFKIENRQLLFFEVTAFTNGRTLWNTDPVGYRGKADTNFILSMEE